MRNRLMVLLIGTLVCALSEPARAQSWREFVTKAEVSLGKGQRAEAIGYLQAGRDQAWKEGGWEGMIRIGHAFAALGETKDAIRSWSIGRDIAWKDAKWEGLFRAGQGFVSIKNYHEAHDAVRMARDVALKQRSWEGLLRASRGFAALDEKKEAYETASSARNVAREKESWQGLVSVGQVLALIGFDSDAEALYRQAELMAERQGKEARLSLAKRVRYLTDTLLIQALGSIRSGLAESWEVSADGRSVMMNLRKGVKCFGGDEVSANSMVAAVKADPKKWEQLEIRRVERLDQYRVRIAAASANASYVLVRLTDPASAIECA